MINSFKLFVISVILLASLDTSAQNDGVGIGTQNVSSDAVLEVKSEDKGVLIPRMNTTTRLSEVNPTSGGLMVFDTEFQAFFYYDTVSTSWKRLVEENSFGTVPLGGIMMWSGSSANIPDGYALCDGQAVNGVTTPDLSNKFLIGGGTPGLSGGEVVVQDSSELNYSTDPDGCSDLQYYSFVIEVTSGQGCTVGQRIEETDVLASSCQDAIFPYTQSIQNCQFDVIECTMTPSPEYYIGNPDCLVAVSYFQIAFIMRVE